jgi:hypothetical protein
MEKFEKIAKYLAPERKDPAGKEKTEENGVWGRSGICS